MKNKKLSFLIALIAVLGITAYTYAAPQYTIMRTILPETGSTYNLGSSTTTWANGYFDTLFGDGSNLTGILSSLPQDLYTTSSPTFAGLTINGLSSTTSLYVSGTSTFNGAVSGISLDEIEDLTTDKVFTLANKTLTWRFTNPAGGTLWDWIGNASGHLWELNQNTGNPTAGTHLAHIQAADSDVLPLHIVHTGTPTPGYFSIDTTDDASSAGDILFVNSSGYTGINNSSPTTPLDINGTTTIRGGNLKLASTTYGISFPDGTFQSTAGLDPSNNLSDVGSSTTSLNNLLPSQTGNSGKVLQTDGANTSWETASGGGITWTHITTSTQGVADNGYITSSSVQIVITLPDTAPTGTILRVAGAGTGGWKIAQNASEKIVFGTQESTVGTSGYLASINSHDSVELVNTVANTEWSVVTVGSYIATSNKSFLVDSTASSTNGLLAYYRLGNTDDYYNGYDLVNTNSATFNSGKIGGAVDFGASNTNKYLSTSSVMGIDGGSISMLGWFNVTTAPALDDVGIFSSQGNNTTDVANIIGY